MYVLDRSRGILQSLKASWEKSIAINLPGRYHWFLLGRGFCFLIFTSLSFISTVRHPGFAGSYSPRTSNRQNPLGPLRPTGPAMKNVPRRGVRSCCALDSSKRRRNTIDASCKSDPGERSGKGIHCNGERTREEDPDVSSEDRVSVACWGKACS